MLQENSQDSQNKVSIWDSELKSELPTCPSPLLWLHQVSEELRERRSCLGGCLFSVHLLLLPTPRCCLQPQPLQSVWFGYYNAHDWAVFKPTTFWLRVGVGSELWMDYLNLRLPSGPHTSLSLPRVHYSISPYTPLFCWKPQNHYIYIDFLHMHI